MQKVSRSSLKQRRDLNNFNHCASPLLSLSLPSKIQILSLSFSVDGQGGVIFIEVPQGSFVLKPSINVPKQIFYGRLAEHMGMRVPTMSFFTVMDQTHNSLLLAMQRYCKVQDECLFARLKIKMDSLFYAVIDYVPSISFESVGRQRFIKMLDSSTKMHEMGVCLGFDLVINNNDRFQFMSGGDGNINNLLIEIPKASTNDMKKAKDRNDISVLFGNLVFIDNEGQMVDVQNHSAASNIKLYILKIKNFIQECLSFLSAQNAEQRDKFLANKHIDKFITHLQLYTGYRMETHHIYEAMLGLRDALDMFLSCQKHGKIKKILVEVQDLCDKNSFMSEFWRKQLKSINLNYCQLLAQEISPIMKQHYAQMRARKTMAKMG